MRLPRQDDDLGLRDRYPPPEVPFSDDYVEAHAAFLCDTLDDGGVMSRFAAQSRLPSDFGVGLDERVVEYPWLFSRELAGLTLDAGSTLNHAFVLDRVLPRLESLHIVTLAPESETFVHSGISYVFADLRELPLRDGCYDTVICLSTLEHVGMDNSIYGGPADRDPDPAAASISAALELLRVVRAGGRLLITVPYGRREDMGWSRQFDEQDVRVLLDALGGGSKSVTVYAYSSRGWQLSSLRGAAEAVYRDRLDERTVPDRAAAARAVACIEIVPA